MDNDTIDFVQLLDKPTPEDVRELFLTLEMTHQQVADALGVTKSVVDKWASTGTDGRSIPTLTWTVLVMLADKHPTHRIVRRRRPR